MIVLTILLAIIVFGIIILIHEFGHYIVAKKNGVKVEEFAIGMGPKLFGKKYKETVYSIRALPLGGFCKMLGEDDASEDERSFTNKSVGVRIAIIAAGPIMNLLLALGITIWFLTVNGYSTTIVREVYPDTPAERADFQSGDKVISIDNQKIHVREEMNFIINETEGRPVEVIILRNGEKIKKTVSPALDPKYNQWLLGFSLEEGSGNFASTIREGFWQVAFLVKQTVIGFVRIITGQIGKDQVAGPIGVIGIIGEAYETGLKSSFFIAVQYVLYVASLISANLGVMNLLPIPALDGGRLVFLIIEAIRGKPIDVEKEGFIHFAGFVLLMILMVFIVYNDIVRMVVS
mgnify:CR=1 FL=1